MKLRRLSRLELEEILSYMLALFASYGLATPKDLELLNALLFRDHLRKVA